MTITDDLVETFLKCPTKCFLRSRGEAGTGNAYVAWVRTKNDVFRRKDSDHNARHSQLRQRRDGTLKALAALDPSYRVDSDA